jgi:hypothetical protein
VSRGIDPLGVDACRAESIRGALTRVASIIESRGVGSRCDAPRNGRGAAGGRDAIGSVRWPDEWIGGEEDKRSWLAMPMQRPSHRALDRFASRRKRHPGGEGSLVTAADWSAWLRLVERKRRLLARHPQTGRRGLPAEYFGYATYASFKLDGMDVTEPQVTQAIARAARRDFRPRQVQRLRNHTALLYRLESSIRLGEFLKPPAIVRWYTSVSCGLSTTSLDDSAMNRLDALVRRINSPQLRLQSAVQEIARLHTQLIADPIVPGFGGILARLLLRYHLGRCGLPPVLFDPATDAPVIASETRLLGRLLEMIDASYNMLLGVER